jgi:HK97 gp10 family phage protein
MITIELIGIDTVTGRIQKVLDVTDKVKSATAQAGSSMQTEARDMAPVDTGTLVKSIQFRMGKGGFEATVKAEAEYAGFVEFGTTKMRAQPYFVPAFVTVNAQYAAALEKILAGA